MTGSNQMTRLLFLVGDTGSGHRSAARAVAQALDGAYPGRFQTEICDALRGPGAAWRLRALVALYGPGIRLTPWLWGWCWHATGWPWFLAWNRRTLFSPVAHAVDRAVSASQPAVIVAFHVMTTDPAVRARDRIVPGTPVITVVTDLITAHLSWRNPAVDRIVVPSAELARRCAADGIPAEHCLETGLPVAAAFRAGRADAAGRARLRRGLGLPAGRFLILMTGGGEGSGGLYRRAAALLRQPDDRTVAVVCGRNRVLYRRLRRLERQAGGRLVVRGFVDNMADWMRCADIVVGKAGPGTIAEAACCAAPLVLTSYLPGQEEGNAEFVVRAGAGRYAPRVRDLVAQLAALQADPAALAAMRAAATRLSRPGAAAQIADLLAALAVPPAARPSPQGRPATAGRT
jgi:1,2-diacylglycerol 3-beta-galactosyltransferase